MNMQKVKQEEAFYNMMHNKDNEIDTLRELISAYLNAGSKEFKEKTLKDLLLYAELKECEYCGHIDLEENMHENLEGYQCDTCWEAR